MIRISNGRVIGKTGVPLMVGTREERADELMYRAIAVWDPRLSVDDRLEILALMKDLLKKESKRRQ